MSSFKRVHLIDLNEFGDRTFWFPHGVPHHKLSLWCTFFSNNPEDLVGFLGLTMETLTQQEVKILGCTVR